MNKIRIVNNELQKDVDSSIIIEETISLIKKINIKIIKDTKLELIYDNYDLKLDFTLEILDNVKLELLEIKQGNNLKLKSKYNLNENSYLKIVKFNDIDEVNENVIVNLNGKNSKINYFFKTISLSNELYNLNIYHNNINTISNIKNNGVAKEGKIVFNISSFVPKNIIGCEVIQNNRIINLSNNISQINPNLYIDCNDVIASHNALIGKFSPIELFYLQSRGIKYDEAIKLLIKGFLSSEIENKQIENIINKYWR